LDREASQELIELLVSAYPPEYAEQRFDFTNNVLFQTKRPSRFRQERGREPRIAVFWLAQRKINHSHKSAPENISFVCSNLCARPTLTAVQFGFAEMNANFRVVLGDSFADGSTVEAQDKPAAYSCGPCAS